MLSRPILSSTLTAMGRAGSSSKSENEDTEGERLTALQSSGQEPEVLPLSDCLPPTHTPCPHLPDPCGALSF